VKEKAKKISNNKPAKPMLCQCNYVLQKGKLAKQNAKLLMTAVSLEPPARKGFVFAN